MIGAIGGSYGYSNSYGAYGNNSAVSGSGAGNQTKESFFTGNSPKGEDGSVRKVLGSDDTKKASGEPCQTCAKRKYQDGSNENVSFKAATHISPEAAGSAVRAHEGEHVSNAYTNAAQNNGKVISASVSIHTSVCPECGRTYVSGGTTSTKIKYPANPYDENKKTIQEEESKGKNIDYAA